MANVAFNIPLSATTIVGNALVLVSIARTSSLISPSNVLLLGIVFTDFCVGLIVQPPYITLKFVQMVDTKINLWNYYHSARLLRHLYAFCVFCQCNITQR